MVASGDTAAFLLEVGGLVLALAILARLAGRLGLSPIPFYLVFGLSLGSEGLYDPVHATAFLGDGAEIGLILLLFMLGVEYSGDELQASLRRGIGGGLADLVLNFTPGLVAGFVLGHGLAGGLVLGGVTYISSSGIIAKVLRDLGRLGNRETPAILTLLVMEDLAMAVLLPVITVVLFGTNLTTGLLTIAVAVTAAIALLFLAMRSGESLSKRLGSPSNEVVVLTLLGLVTVLAGVTEQLKVSAAVGAFLFGLAVSGELAEKVQALFGPLRDLFAAVFFLWFGLNIQPMDFPPVLLPAVILLVVTSATKIAAGHIATPGIGPAGRLRAGTALVARGEFSIVMAGLGLAAGLDARVAALAAAYVTLSAVVGPVATRYSDAWSTWRSVRRDRAASDALPD